MTDIAVLGAGVVGLSTALRIQETIPHVRVTVIADGFNQDTTSYGAAGIFRPVLAKTPGIHPAVLRQWLRDSWAQFNKLAHSPDAAEAGVMPVSGYQFFNDDREYPLYKDICYDFRHCNPTEMAMFPGPRYRHGWFCTSMVTQSKFYLPYLMKKIKQNGGQFKKHKVTSFEEFVGRYDVVVNCMGLGNHTVLNDDKMTAIRGQIYVVEAPWLKHFVYHGDSCYIIPVKDGVVVGGVKQKGNFNLNHSQADAVGIWEDAVKILPALKKCKVVKEWVGLRPHREPLRLERETMVFRDSKLQVVHNYGHGAEGVSYSWGTAVHATRLVQETLRNPASLQSKL